MTGLEPQPHNWSIAEREYARQESRRGRRYAYEDLDPVRTALVVVDMVPFFTAARRVVPNINLLAGALRGAGGTVAWVLPDSGPPSDWATGFYGPAVATMYAASGGTGSLRERLFPELDARADDVWAEKSAASAFFPGRSTLPASLEERNVDTLLITGTVTSVCGESTARDAATLGYRVVFVADGTADGWDSVHNATLRTIYRSFGEPSDSRRAGVDLAAVRLTSNNPAAACVDPACAGSRPRCWSSAAVRSA
jgi:nicotinamidase-related amidase